MHNEVRYSSRCRTTGISLPFTQFATLCGTDSIFLVVSSNIHLLFEPGINDDAEESDRIVMQVDRVRSKGASAVLVKQEGVFASDTDANMEYSAVLRGENIDTTIFELRLNCQHVKAVSFDFAENGRKLVKHSLFSELAYVLPRTRKDQ